MHDLIAVVDRYTGKILNFSQEHARDQIAQGTAVETVPSDVSAAERWRADLRAKVMAEVVQRQIEKDIAPFEEYENWCATQGRHALPAKVEDVTLYLLSLLRDGAAKYELSVRAYSLQRIHDLANHPPPRLGKAVLHNLFRALEFAKLKLGSLIGRIEDADQIAARKALEMFPSGNVPKRYSDIV